MLKEIKALAYQVACDNFAGALAFNLLKIENGAQMENLWRELQESNDSEVYQIIMMLAVMGQADQQAATVGGDQRVGG